jgi:hypothetical protein
MEPQSIPAADLPRGQPVNPSGVRARRGACCTDQPACRPANGCAEGGDDDRAGGCRDVCTRGRSHHATSGRRGADHRADFGHRGSNCARLLRRDLQGAKAQVASENPVCHHPILSKNYFEKVGQDGFTAAPVGPGPYKFVKSAPKTSMEFAANTEYWDTVKPQWAKVIETLVPEEATHVAQLERGDFDMIANLSFDRLLELKNNGYRLQEVWSADARQHQLPRHVHDARPDLGCPRAPGHVVLHQPSGDLRHVLQGTGKARWVLVFQREDLGV